MRFDDRVIGGFLIIVLLGLWINFDPILASLFFAMIIGSLWLISTDKVKSYTIESNPNKIKSLMLGVIGYVIFLVSSMIGLAFLKRTALTSSYSINSVADAFAQTQSVMMSNVAPALADNLKLTLLAFALLIPIIETFSFTVFFEFLSERFPGLKNMTLSSFRTWLMISIISLLFMFFHFTAKGLTNHDALLMVVIFGLISWGLVVYEGQSLSAIIMHIIANTIAVFSMYNITISDNPWIIYTIVGVAIYALIKNKKYRLFSGVRG